MGAIAPNILTDFSRISRLLSLAFEDWKETVDSGKHTSDVPHLPRREGNGQQREAIRHHQRAADTRERAQDAQPDEVPAEARGEREDDPDQAGHRDHVLVAVDHAQTAADEDESALCQPVGSK